MPAVKPLDRISKKWTDVSQRSQGSYEEGVKNPRRSWSEATAAAEASYEQGVSQAIQQKRFGKGVKAAGDSAWSKGAIEKGPGRWAEGVRVGQSNYEKGFAPFRQVIENTTLPPRGPKGDPKNIDRVRAMAGALHKAKLDKQGS